MVCEVLGLVVCKVLMFLEGYDVNYRFEGIDVRCSC